MAVDNLTTRWYIYYHKEKGGLSTSLDAPEIGNKDGAYEVYGPYKNTEIVDKWIEKRKEICKG